MNLVEKHREREKNALRDAKVEKEEASRLLRSGNKFSWKYESTQR